jgi:putative membrane protein
LIPLSSLPALNAALNSASALLLAAGYLFIRSGKIAAHRRCMLAALATSTLFLTSYLIYHYHVGSVPFTGQGWTRRLYFTILISHTSLAVTIVPLVLITLYRALRSRFERHKRIARWTLPLWLYVSVTGVIVYGMLYGF